MVAIKHDNWWKGKVSLLSQIAERVGDVEPDVVYNKKGYWPALKLVIMQYALGFYIPVMGGEVKKGSWDSMHFVDLCAGSGLTRVNPALHKEEPVIRNSKPMVIGGSALVGAASHAWAQEHGHRPFDAYHFVEPNEKSISALERRAKLLVPQERVHVYPGQASQRIKDVVDRIQRASKNPHFIAFVDPEGLTEVTFADLQQLLDVGRGDVVFNFQYQGATRAPAACDRFFGRDDWPRDGSDAEIQDYFHRMMAGTGRSETAFFDIKAGGMRYAYEVAYSAPRTNAGNPWLRSFEAEISKRMSGLDGRGLEDILFGQTTLF